MELRIWRNLILLILTTVFLCGGKVSAQESNLEDTTPKNVPLKIEILNADSENWLETLEVKVTNTKKKPIYYLEFGIVFNDIKSADNLSLMIPLIYGDQNLVPLNQLAKEDDKPILFGESYTLKPKDSLVKAFLKSRKNEKLTAKLDFEWLSFGDGTGIMRKGVFFPPKYKTAAQ